MMRFSELMERVGKRGVKILALSPGEWNVETEVTGVAEDSRKVKPGDVFVARGGTKTSGEKYAYEAMERGAVATILPREHLGSGKKAYFRNASAVVDDVNLACALLAH